MYIFCLCLFLEKTKQTVKLDASTVEIEERGVKLRLTVVDTPGFGDAIDNSDRYDITYKIIILLLIFRNSYNCNNSYACDL